MADLICIHCFVSGKVQGVWFRASTKEQADNLGVTGWVRNLPDGRVEVMAAGERQKLASLHTWLQHGPRLAKVTHLTYEECPWQAFAGFKQR
jgi:acylphosphatase